MAIDFPASPTNGQTYVVGSVTYTWDGTKWTATASGGGGGVTDKIQEGNTSAEVIDTGSDGRFVVTTEGTEALRVDSSQRVGIGNSAPNYKLDVSVATNDPTTGSPAAGSFINVTGGTTTVGHGPSISLSNVSGAKETGWRVSAVTTSGNNGDLVFNGYNGGANLPERLRITAGGSVGIGTSTVTGFSDYTTVQLGSSSSGSALRLVASGDTPGTDDFVIYKNTSGSYLRSYGDPIVFYGNSSEYGRWDTSGRLLVGTSSARSNFLNTSVSDAKTQIEGTDRNTSSLSLTSNNTGSGNPAILYINKSKGSSIGSNTILSSGDELGGVYFQGNDGSEFVVAAAIDAVVDGTPGANDMPGRLVFSTTADGASSSTERMRIDNLGRIFTYNANTGNNSLTVASAAGAGTAVANFIGAYGATAVNTGTSSFIVWTNGNVQNTNNSYGAISDIKLKENIVDANSQWDDLKALQVRNYNFKESQTHTQIGLIAQEVELVSPGLVSESPDRDEEGNDLGTVTKSVNYSVLYMKAVKALQEAMERIEVLEAKVNALEGN